MVDRVLKICTQVNVQFLQKTNDSSKREITIWGTYSSEGKKYQVNEFLKGGAFQAQNLFFDHI